MDKLGELLKKNDWKEEKSKKMAFIQELSLFWIRAKAL